MVCRTVERYIGVGVALLVQRDTDPRSGYGAAVVVAAPTVQVTWRFWRLTKPPARYGARRLAAALRAALWPRPGQP